MRTLLLSAIILLSLNLDAQKDETIFGRNGVRLTGFWGGSTTSFNDFGDDFDIDGGGFFAFEISKSFLLGWSNSDQRTFIEEAGNVRLRSHDFLVGYSPMSYRALHPYFYTTIGTAKVETRNEGWDRVLSVQPTAALELNVLRWFRISAEGGYRFISGSDFTTITDEKLSSPYIGLRLKFGWSWGR